MPTGYEIDEKTKTQIHELDRQGKKQDEIAAELNISKGAVNKYLHEPPPLAPEQPVIKTVEQPQTATVIESRKLEIAQTPYPEILEPDQWLRQFLDGYRLREVFIQAQCSRVKRRNQLPTATDLMMDLKEGDSGAKNPLLIRDIAEDYDFVVEEYLKQRDIGRPLFRRKGIPLTLPSDRGYDREGIPLQQPEYYGRPPACDYYGRPLDYGRTDYGRPSYREPYPTYPRWEGIPLAQPATPPTIDQELERYIRIQQLLGRTDQKNPLTERYEKDLQDTKAKLDKLVEERQRELYDELNQLRTSYQTEHQRRTELENELRRLEFQSSQKGLSETDIKYQELKDRQELELRKLDEKAKTRDTIAKAVSSGFSQIGQAVFRTAQELGGGEQTEMVGISDGRHMWQASCPYCGTQITAPLSAKTVICPGCGKQLETAGENQTPIPPPFPPFQPPAIKTVASPDQKEVVANCPYCNNPMRIPENAKLVACPHCNKRLEVTSATPKKIPEPSSEAGFIVDQQPLPPLPPPPVEISEQWEQHTPLEEDEEVFHTKPTDPEEEPKPPTHTSVTGPGTISLGEDGSGTSGEEPKQYTCDFCGKPFDDKKKFEGHRLSHLRWKHKKLVIVKGK